MTFDITRAETQVLVLAVCVIVLAIVVLTLVNKLAETSKSLLQLRIDFACMQNAMIRTLWRVAAITELVSLDKRDR